ncbi:MAG: prepilin-type N-terminal cleavage/methylation domain-containing protein [Planctomycetaceae bacterium]
MHALRPPRPHRSRSRAGFTLVELLVVVALIAILAGLTLRVAVGVINQGREAATKSTLQKIQRLLNSRLEEFNRRFGGNDPSSLYRLESTPEYTLAGQLVVNNSGNTPVLATGNARRILTRKLLYIKYFPQSARELDPGLQPELWTALVQMGGPTATSDVEAEISSSEILHDLVVNSTSLGDVGVGLDSFLNSEVADTDGDGRKEFVDGWQQPIVFYRWPVLLFWPGFAPQGNPANTLAQFTNATPTVEMAQRLISTLPVNTSLANHLARDPQDPLNLLGGIPEFAEGGLMPSGNNLVRLQYPGTFPQSNNRRVAGFHFPGTFHCPLLVSAGPNGVLGLLPPVYGTSVTPTQYGYLGQYDSSLATQADLEDALSDNITSLNIRAGGR